MALGGIMIKSKTYELVKAFKKKYPGTIAWRLKVHSKVIDKHLNPGEETFYAFPAQQHDNSYNMISTCVVALTNKRILVGQKRLLFGYFFNAITPDLFNDLSVETGIIWGRVHIDTVKELVSLSNISKKAVPEIESMITEYMMGEKQKYCMPRVAGKEQ
jgi:hypothetical protein